MSALRIMGVDLEPCGGSRCFSVAVLEDGTLKAKYESIPLHRLIRIIWEQSPRILALDNIYELAGDRRELAKVLSLLPPELEVVQVTRLPSGELVPLKRLARLAGIDPGPGKLTPSKTAYLAALLASMGYGSPLRRVEERTRIVVAKQRRLRSGGMSARRYQRRVRAAILRAVKDIKRALDRAGFDYDLVFRKSGGGLDSAVFVVYAPRSSLNGVVKPHQDTDVRIDVEPVYRPAPRFEEQQPRRRFLIVGIDPGISTGIAALDLNGRLVFAVTRRGVDRGEVVELIRSHGIPLVIASDVTPAPDFVKKLAGMLRAQLYEPPAPLSVEEKRSILEDYVSKYPQLKRLASPHVRDALAAAVKALRFYESKLRQLESSISRIGIEINIEDLKAAVIRGTSIAEALENLISSMLDQGAPQHEAKPPAGEKRPQPRSTPSEEIELLRAENHALRAKIKVLEERLRHAEAEARLLSLEMRENLERDREVAMLRERLARLQEELERLRSENASLRAHLASAAKAIYMAASGYVPAPIRSDATATVVDELDDIASEMGRTVLVLTSPNTVNLERHAERLARLLIALLVPRDLMERAKPLEARGCPVLAFEDYVAVEVDKVALLDPRILADAYRRRAELEEKKRRREQEKRAQLTRDKLRRMLEEYRMRRAKILAGEGNGAPSGKQEA